MEYESISAALSAISTNQWKFNPVEDEQMKQLMSYTQSEVCTYMRKSSVLMRSSFADPYDPAKTVRKTWKVTFLDGVKKLMKDPTNDHRQMARKQSIFEIVLIHRDPMFRQIVCGFGHNADSSAVHEHASCDYILQNFKKDSCGNLAEMRLYQKVRDTFLHSPPKGYISLREFCLSPLLKRLFSTKSSFETSSDISFFVVSILHQLMTSTGIFDSRGVLGDIPVCIPPPHQFATTYLSGNVYTCCVLHILQLNEFNHFVLQVLLFFVAT